MSECILHGHALGRFPGVGQFAGRAFDVCTRCGRTWDAETGNEMQFDKTKQHFQAALQAWEKGEWFPSSPSCARPSALGRKLN